MANLVNLTHFAAANFHSITKEGADVLVVCVAGRFELPTSRFPRRDELRISEKQIPPPPADVWWGEPGKSSLRYENQTTYVRPATDIYLNGHAYAPGGRKVTEMRVSLQVAKLSKEVAVIGDREWRSAVLGVTQSSPKPFDRMPLVYERAFGGDLPAEPGRKGEWEPRNPVGRGCYRDASEASGKPLPNLEDPQRRIISWSDRVPPAGFGPIARAWQPRLSFGGTYDQAWLEQRCPLWPLDLDLRFFQAAAPGLAAIPHLKGGEPVRLEGASPDRRIEFEVPKKRFIVKSTFRYKVAVQSMLLDGLLIEPDENAVTAYWRATVQSNGILHLHEQSVVRELEPWEDLPA